MSDEIFRTVIPVQPAGFNISYQSPALFVGSCFTENIGEYLKKYKFPVLINPFGITYNPVSIKTSLERLLEKKFYSSGELDLYNGLYFSFDHHSRFSNPDQSECLNLINHSFGMAADLLKSCSYIFITLGSAYYYRHKESGRIVSNCHKLPDKAFVRERLSVSEIVQDYEYLFQLLMQHNPASRIIITVSPVRHWKDGAHENQLSKAVLLLAVEELQEKFGHIVYFPAYELMMDELRDYRFYDEDMLHPNKTATEFIWKRFLASFIGKETLPVMDEIEKIILASAHRPFNTETETFRKFSLHYLQKTEALMQKFPYLQLTPEYDYFRQFAGS